jgi:hypothetical protein
MALTMASGRLLVSVFVLSVLVVGIASCGSGGGGSCSNGLTEVCLDDGVTCVCTTSCSTYADCVDGTTRRFCDLSAKACVPPSLLHLTCPTVGVCEGAACVATSAGAYACAPLCLTSSECASGCCETGVYPHCAAVSTSGGKYPAGTCMP